MKRSFTLLAHAVFLFFAIAKESSGQYSLISRNADQRATGMAQSGVVLNNPVNALGNPAHLGFIQSKTAGLAGQPYLRVRDLGMISASIALPAGDKQAVGLTLMREGSKELNETMAGISMGRKIGSRSAIGIGLSLLHRQLPESRSANGIIPEIGIQTALTRSLSLGILFRNPVPVEIQKNVRFQSDYRAGILYRANYGLDIYLSLSKSGSSAAMGAAGIEYSLNEAFRLRLGARSNGSYAFGLGIIQKQYLMLDLAADIHHQTGPIFGLGIQYRRI
jgi:hypothetical protein